MLEKRDFIHEAWHLVDRIGAEKLLENKALGSFIFRKDLYAEMLENQLKLNLDEKISCLTLSYLAEVDKVEDRTLVHKNNRWYFYDDNTHVSGPSFESIPAVIKSMGSKLTFPIVKK